MPENFISEAKELHENGQVDKAIDLILDEIDKMLRQGEVGRCDKVLRQIYIPHCPTTNLIAFLSATAPARGLLRNRKWFFDMVEKEFEKRRREKFQRKADEARQAAESAYSMLTNPMAFRVFSGDAIRRNGEAGAMMKKLTDKSYLHGLA